MLYKSTKMLRHQVISFLLKYFCEEQNGPVLPYKKLFGTTYICPRRDAHILAEVKKSIKTYEKIMHL